MFEYNGQEYEMKFNMQRVQLVETATKSSLIGEWYNSNGMFQLSTINAVGMFCMKESGSDKFLSQKEGSELIQNIMKENGYASVALKIQEQMKEDMPFLFQAN